MSGSGYANPLYWGDSCSAETGDCTIGASGGFAYWVSVAYIYVGSTLADEEYIPQTATGPPIVDDSAYNSFLLEIGQTSTGQVIQVIRDWKAAIALIAGVIITAENALNPQKDDPGQNPIPYQLELVADTYENPQPGVQIRPTRLRTYFIKDTNGYNWHNDKPLTIKEQFSAIQGSGDIPAAHDWIYNRAGDIDYLGRMTDNYQISAFNNNELGYWQRYWATGFNAPGLVLPQINGYPSGIVPLMIKDQRSDCIRGVFGTQGIDLNYNWVGINGDWGPGTACQAK